MSRRIIYVIVAVAMVAVIALAWFFAISPARRDVANTTSQNSGSALSFGFSSGPACSSAGDQQTG